MWSYLPLIYNSREYYGSPGGWTTVVFILRCSSPNVLPGIILHIFIGFPTKVYTLKMLWFLSFASETSKNDYSKAYNT